MLAENGQQDAGGVLKLPAKVCVAELVSSRYPAHIRPASWAGRRAGIDQIRSVEGNFSIKLASDGGQAPPQPGCTLMLTGGDPQSGYRWTLYGLPRR